MTISKFTVNTYQAAQLTHQAFLTLDHLCNSFFDICTGCVRQNENPTSFKILKEPLLIQRQTLHQQKALDLCYLELEAKGSMTSPVSQRCHRRQGVKNPPRTCRKSTKNVFCAKGAWHPHDTATTFSFQLQMTEIMSFLLM